MSNFSFEYLQNLFYKSINFFVCILINQELHGGEEGRHAGDRGGGGGGPAAGDLQWAQGDTRDFQEIIGNISFRKVTNIFQDMSSGCQEAVAALAKCNGRERVDHIVAIHINAFTG